MKKFENYLIKKGYTPRTIKSYLLLFGMFTDWCRAYEVNIDTATLEELYDYQSFNRERGDKPSTMQGKISVIKHYYRFIKRKNNPALLVQTEKQEKQTVKNILDEETLMNIYLDYQPEAFVFTRDKVMLGLFIFQGLTRGEIESLELHHIELEKNRIYIPQTVTTNKRYLTLHPIQKRELKTYINQERKELLNTYHNTSTSQLFFSTRSKKSLTDVHNQMLRRIKKIFPYLISFKQIRSSRITIWVSQNGIRKAQYMSGMKNVTSLIRYRQADKEKLKQKLDVVHPMERLNL
jgi:integrase/recombinase XerD